MHYANTFACHEKLKGRTEHIEPCGAGGARQKIRNDNELVDHDRVTWDGTGKVLRLPPGLDDEQVAAVIRIYREGHNDGVEEGRDDIRCQLRHILRVARED